MVKINLDCVGRGPAAQRVEPSIKVTPVPGEPWGQTTFLTPKVTTIKAGGFEVGCCIKDVEMYPPNHPEQSTKLSVKSITAEAADKIAKDIAKYDAETVGGSAIVLSPLGWIGAFAPYAGILVTEIAATAGGSIIAGITALGIDAYQRCSSQQLLIAGDAAYRERWPNLI